MAITYGAKLFESSATTRVTTHTLTAAANTGALVCVAVAGKRSGSYLNISSVSDSQGHAWDWEMAQSEYRACGVIWTRLARALAIGDTITVTWNGTPSYSWKSAHSFEGASGSETADDHTFGTSSTASLVLDVSGSDWLTFAVVMCPYADGPTLTPLNSSLSRDSNGTNRPFAECFSRNGTTGTTHTIGASGVTGGSYAIAGVSFPFLAMPSSPARAVPSMVGI